MENIKHKKRALYRELLMTYLLIIISITMIGYGHTASKIYGILFFGIGVEVLNIINKQLQTLKKLQKLEEQNARTEKDI